MPATWSCSRGELLKRQDRPLGLPELDAGAYIVNALVEAGPTIFDGMGERPLSWVDIDAYARATGGDWQPWELRAVFGMSRAYLAGKQAGKEPLAVPPTEDQGAQ